MSNLSKKTELAKNTIIILIGKFCTQFLSFLLLPIYTSVLKTNEFGVVDLATTYINLIVPCITVQLGSAAFRFLVDSRSDERMKTVIISSILLCAIAFTCFWVLIYEIVGVLINIPYKNYLVFVVIATIASNLSLQIARGFGNNIAYSIGSVIAGGCTILFNILFLVIVPMGPSGMFLSLIISNILCALFVTIRCKISDYISLNECDKNTIRDLLKYSAPLVPNGIIWWIINAFDRTIIASFLGTASNGIYAVSHKFSNAVMSASYVFNMSWTESTSLHLKDNDNFINETFQTMLKLFSSLCLWIIGCMPFVFPLMVKGDYVEAYLYIPILIIGSVFNITVGLIGAIYVALKKTKEIAQTSLWSGIINIVVNVCLIKFIGLYAASISTAVAFGIMALYRYHDVQKYVSLKIRKVDFIILVSSFIISTILYYKNSFPFNLINILFVVAVSIIINSQFIVTIYSKYVQK